MRASSPVRGLRAAVFTVLGVLLAAGGHALATGAAPPVGTQATACVPVFGAAWLLGRRERSLPAVAAGTLTAQGALHAWFGAACRSGTASTRPMRSPMSMPLHSLRAVPSRAPVPHPHVLAAHATAGHVLAALLLTWWLRRGEAALWSLLRRAAALVPGLVAWWRAPGGPEVPDAARPARDGRRVPRGRTLRHSVRRRGPPPGIPCTR